MRRLVCLVSLLAFAACDSAPLSVDPPVAAIVIPLDVGESWMLRTTQSVRFDGDGAALDTVVVVEPSDVVLAVTRDSLIGGERWARIEFTSDRTFTNYVVPREGAWFANRDGALYRLDGTGQSELLFDAAAPVGRPFVETDLFDVELLDPAAHIDVAGAEIEARVFGRTEKRTTGFGAAAPGPVTPRVQTRQVLSSEAGIVALEVLYLRPNEAGEWVPVRLVRSEAAPGA